LWSERRNEHARGLGVGVCIRVPRLLEDEAVGIMERPAFGRCRSVARTIAATHLRFVPENPGAPRTELVRPAMKRLRRISPVITLYALPVADLNSLLDEIFKAAVQWVG
jgi:hypothetical protein